MLKLRFLWIWVLERLIEIILGAYLLLQVYGTNASSTYPGIVGDLYMNAIYVSFFYIASGFVISTLYFGLWKRVDNLAIQSLIMTGAFLTHLFLIMLLGRIDSSRLSILAFYGATIITLTSFTGSLIFKRIRS